MNDKLVSNYYLHILGKDDGSKLMRLIHKTSNDIEVRYVLQKNGKFSPRLMCSINEAIATINRLTEKPHGRTNVAYWNGVISKLKRIKSE